MQEQRFTAIHEAAHAVMGVLAHRKLYGFSEGFTEMEMATPEEVAEMEKEVAMGHCRSAASVSGSEVYKSYDNIHRIQLPNKAHQPFMEWQMKISFAGAMAEFVARGGDVDDFTNDFMENPTCESDYQKVCNVLRDYQQLRFGRTSAGLEARAWRQFEAQTYKLVKKNWRAIEVLAEALMRERHLIFDEAYPLIVSHLPKFKEIVEAA